MIDASERPLFDRIRVMPDGPVKKFQLIKRYGKAVSDHHEIDGMTLDPRILSCAELVECIDLLIEGIACSDD